MNRRQLVIGLLRAGGLASLSPHLRAHEYYTTAFTVVHPWAEPTAPGVRDAAVFVRFDDIRATDALIGARSDIAESVELRGSGAVGILKSISLREGQTVELSPGGTHLMMRGLNVALRFDRSYPLTLVFEKSGELQTMLSVGAH